MTEGWYAAIFLLIPFAIYCAVIWNKPTYRHHEACEGCGESHSDEALFSDGLYAMTGLWLIAGWPQCPTINNNNQGR